MCLSLFKEETKKRKAKKPIACYKVLVEYRSTDGDNTLLIVSPIHHYVWNRIYMQETKIKISYREYLPSAITITEGFHAFCNEEDALEAVGNRSVYKMIIPQGSTYYTEGKHIVSNRMTLVRKIK